MFDYISLNFAFKGIGDFYIYFFFIPEEVGFFYVSDNCFIIFLNVFPLLLNKESSVYGKNHLYTDVVRFLEDGLCLFNHDNSRTDDRTKLKYETLVLIQTKARRKQFGNNPLQDSVRSCKKHIFTLF